MGGGHCRQRKRLGVVGGWETGLGWGLKIGQERALSEQLKTWTVGSHCRYPSKRGADGV